ncbi:hypothetical protein L6164_017234 [Bauhinia variegata]|uniref:Uncharacterized protein n=1 Tax=Bauhinia variegata TaxID=167791 RepID=A0ACB9N8T0_BAUVA|nr:hypothetical protein L6164_017234 [Bauhinia variegata]
MAKNPIKLAEVDCSSEAWKLPIRVTSMWKVFKFGKMQSLDIVFMDANAFNVDDGRNVKVKRKNIVSPMVEFNLLDLNQNVISCTLWNDFANKFISYMEMKPPSPVVIILTQANIKDTKTKLLSSGLYPVGVQSYWTTSKLFINEDIKEINEFKARYRVEVLVHDKENHARFVLWDRECMKLTGHIINELIEHLREARVTNFNEFPQAVDYLVGKICAFKIKLELDGATSLGEEIYFFVLELTDAKDLVHTLWDKVEHIKTSMLVDNHHKRD